MANEQNILECAFYAMGKFAFDRVKEICDKEKDAVKNPQGLALGWSQFMGSLSQLCIAEKTYFGLGFLLQTPNNPKAFRKKEVPLQAQFGQIKQELDKQMEALQKVVLEPASVLLPPADKSSTASTIPGAVLIHLGAQLSHFTTARLDMIEIYEQLHEMGLNKESNYNQLITKVDLVVSTYGKKFHHPLLAFLEASFCYETEVLKNLIEAQLRIQECNFMASLIRLNNALRRLSLWPTTSQGSEPMLTGNKVSLLQKPVPSPALLLWFTRYHTALFAKFSLYFHEVLSKQAPSTELKNLLAKTSPDYYQRIVTFHRKSDALSICIILDTNGMDFRGMGGHIYNNPEKDEQACRRGWTIGYRHPNHETDAPTGLESYPAIFYYPGDRPTKLWPTIVMALTMESDRLAQLDAIVTINDKGMEKERTYFLIRIEPRFYIAVVFESKKSDKDTTINQFLLEMTTNLRCSKTLESLKPA